MLRHALGCQRLAASAAMTPLSALHVHKSAVPLSASFSHTFGVRAASAAAVHTADVASPAAPPRKRLIKVEGRTLRKAYIINRMEAAFGGSKLVAVLQHNSLNVAEFAKLRETLEAKNIHMTMFPNTLARVALKRTSLEALSPLFHSSSLVMYSPDPALKDLSDIVKKNKKLHLLGVHVEGMVLDVEGINKFLTLPSMEQLRGELLAVINQPARMLAAMLQRGSSDLVWALQTYIEDKKPKDEEKPAE